jgi:nucleoside-diphosphate-sugar epimerase
MSCRILITGATGFVGRAIARHFVGAGHAVVASYRAGHPEIAGVEWLPVGAGPVSAVSAALNRHAIDTVIHTAGRINGAPANVVAANEGHTGELLDAIEAAQAKPDIYFLSTVSAIEPTSIYGQTKRRAEQMVGVRAPARWAALRASLLHGPGDNKNVAALVRAARYWPAIPVIGGANIKLQPLYVEDLVSAFDALVARQGPSGATYIVSGPRQERLVDMIRVIQDRIGRYVPLIPVPLAPVQSAIAVADRLLPFLKLPAQQVRALRDHPMYRSDEASRELGFAPRFFAETIAEYL